jgi:hypothetical protein
MKFDIGQFYQNLARHCNFCNGQTTTTTLLGISVCIIDCIFIRVENVLNRTCGEKLNPHFM